MVSLPDSSRAIVARTAASGLAILRPGEPQPSDPQDVVLQTDSVNAWRAAASLSLDAVAAVHGLPMVVTRSGATLAMAVATSNGGATLLVMGDVATGAVANYTLDVAAPAVQPVATEDGQLLLLSGETLHAFDYTSVPPALLWVAGPLLDAPSSPANFTASLAVTPLGGIVYVSRGQQAVGLSLSSGEVVWPVPDALSATAVRRGAWSAAWAVPSAPQQAMLIAQGTPQQSLLPVGAPAPAEGWWVATEDFQNDFIARAYTVRLPFPAAITDSLARPTPAQPWVLPRHPLTLAHAPEALHVAHASSGTVATLRLCTRFPAPQLSANLSHVAFASWRAPDLPENVKVSFYTLLIDGEDGFNVFASVRALNIPYRTPGSTHTVQLRARLSTGTNLRSAVASIVMPDDPAKPDDGLAYVDLQLRLLPVRTEKVPEAVRQELLAQLCNPVEGAVLFYCYFTFLGTKPSVGGAAVLNGTIANTRALVSSNNAKRIEKEMRAAVSTGALLRALKDDASSSPFWNDVTAIALDGSSLGGDVGGSGSTAGSVGARGAAPARAALAGGANGPDRLSASLRVSSRLIRPFPFFRPMCSPL